MTFTSARTSRGARSGPVGESATPTALRAQGPLPLGQDPRRYPTRRSSRHDLRRVAPTHLFDAAAQRLVAGREYLGGEDPRVHRTRVADGDGRDRNASGHLDGREERVEPTGDRVRRDERHADHRKRGERRDRTGEVRRTAGTTDHDADATSFEPIDPVAERLGGAVRRKDPRLALHAEAL